MSFIIIVSGRQCRQVLLQGKRKWNHIALKGFFWYKQKMLLYCVYQNKRTINMSTCFELAPFLYFIISTVKILQKILVKYLKHYTYKLHCMLLTLTHLVFHKSFRGTNSISTNVWQKETTLSPCLLVLHQANWSYLSSLICKPVQDEK